MGDGVMKHNRSHRVTAGLAGVAIMVMAGCAQPPTEQLEAARKAVEMAQTAGASEYAKEDLAKLEQQFALAKDELATQEKALFIFRSYSEANKMLIQVVETSGQVAAKAAQNKEAAKTAALTMEKEAQLAVVSAKEVMGKAPSGKDKTAVEAIRQEVAGLATSLNAVHELIQKGDYLGAEVQAKAVKEKAAAASAEIQSAIEKTKGKTPKVHA
jgi:hypothetical protein